MSDMGALLSSIPLWIRLSNGFSCNYYSIFYYAHLELTILNTFMASSIFNVMALTMERLDSYLYCPIGSRFIQFKNDFDQNPDLDLNENLTRQSFRPRSTDSKLSMPISASELEFLITALICVMDL